MQYACYKYGMDAFLYSLQQCVSLFARSPRIIPSKSRDITLKFCVGFFIPTYKCNTQYIIIIRRRVVGTHKSPCSSLCNARYNIYEHLACVGL